MRTFSSLRHSLALRLTLFSAAFVGVVLILLGLVARDLVREAIEQQWRTELQNRLNGLVAYQDVLPITSIDPGLYGELYSGNYWEVFPDTQGTQQASISLADFSLVEQLTSPVTAGSFHRLNGPLGEPLLALVDDALPTVNQPRRILIARDATELDRLLTQVLRQMNGIELLIWLAAIAATAVSTRIGAQPVRTLAGELDQLRAGKRQRVSETLPTELAPLARTLNQVMALNEARLRRQRDTAANLAHELKTPLTALQQQTELRTQLDAEFVRDKVQRMWEPLEQELARARIHGPAPGLEPTPVQTEVERAIRLCASDHAVQPQDFSVSLPPGFTLPLETRDLFTVIWNLLDNAIRHGAVPVRIQGDEYMLQVEDSGNSGTPTSASSGAGLRLVEHILDAYDWQLQVGPSPLGGRRCTICRRS